MQLVSRCVLVDVCMCALLWLHFWMEWCVCYLLSENDSSRCCKACMVVDQPVDLIYVSAGLSWA